MGCVVESSQQTEGHGVNRRAHVVITAAGLGLIVKVAVAASHVGDEP
jgi:hypothetical protein